ncbi:HNH endonuclease [Xanthomonas sp. WHRI 10064A]|uniref:HNH endonuclease n=1 Tax=unclassified Xanthomonas TaxID=2643310 RepID=UPI002B236B94|nr:MULTISPECIES: HNH endonuclease [unclassified Xanthomonas]MEA9585938.1 HNH endonuclease [Xanthomonas sp. WHRI 10064B]MEA9614365.1 HNH endonuclease [Xanthomonas sp. WHRI 10064A]
MTPTNEDKTILSGSLEECEEHLLGALNFAIGFAKQQGAPLALNASQYHMPKLLALLDPTAVEMLVKGETLSISSGPLLMLIDDAGVENFVGLVLFVGVDAPRLALLNADRSPMVIAVPENEEERSAILEAFPNAGRLEIKQEPETIPLPRMHPSYDFKCQWLDERYDVIAGHHFNRKSAEIVLGAGEPQVCRYCGRSTPAATFENVSHAFPEQIGNKWLVDSRECDGCNEHFATAIDSPLGDWSLLARSTGRIRGKRKVPKFVSSDEDVRIVFKNNVLNVTAYKDDPRLRFDENAKRIEMQLERPPYIPMGVFKSFVKMAISVMPEIEASKCQHLKNWILEKKHTIESFPFHPLMLYTQFISGPIPNDEISFMLVRRKASVSGCPYMMFMVQYGNHVHQIALPMPTEDGMGREPIQTSIAYFPHPWEAADHIAAYGPARCIEEDLSSPDFRRNEPYPMNFSFSEAISTMQPTGS